MSPDDEIRELKAFFAELLNESDEMLKIIRDDDALESHVFSIRWLIPQVQAQLSKLRQGELVDPHSRDFAPVGTLEIVLDHIECIIQRSIRQMDDEEFDRLERLTRRR